MNLQLRLANVNDIRRGLHYTNVQNDSLLIKYHGSRNYLGNILGNKAAFKVKA